MGEWENLDVLSSLFRSLSNEHTQDVRTQEGVAFLSATCLLYKLKSLSYLAINIPVPGGDFKHFHQSNHGLWHRSGPDLVSPGRLAQLGLLEPGICDWRTEDALRVELALVATHLKVPLDDLNALTVPIDTTRGETVLLGMAATVAEPEWIQLKRMASDDIRILIAYFHSHILRLSGIDTERELLVSARELDCLKWTALGKTAWEASQILGISERTVRFHLNSAREKLKCSNTTQAVAMAVSQRLIAL